MAIARGVIFFQIVIRVRMSGSASVEDHSTNDQAQENECSDDEAGDKAGVVVLFIAIIIVQLMIVVQEG